jgi:predicted aspartyl protease
LIRRPQSWHPHFTAARQSRYLGRLEMMTSPLKIGVIVAATIVGLASKASADICAPLTTLASVDLSFDSAGRPLIPVTMEATEKLMLVDTGGVLSEITPQAAAELKLPQKSVGVLLYDASGRATGRAATLSRFLLGRLTATSFDLMVGTDTDLGYDSRIAGIFAPGNLSHYDVDFDFGAAKFNLFSPDHCEGKVVYWQTNALAVVPIRISHAGHIVLPITLDGHRLTALLDTGSDGTYVTRSSAEGEIGLDLNAPDVIDVGTLPDRPNARMYQHVFKTLALEGISVANPTVGIIPDLTHFLFVKPPPLGSHIQAAPDPDAEATVILGMNVLRHLHVYVAYKEQKLYISPR